MKELKDRTLEVAICIEAVIILVLICLVLHLMLQCPYDVNKDGQVNLGDVSETYNYYINGNEYNEFDLNYDGHISVDNTNAIVRYINEN